MMRYYSTRGNKEQVTAGEAILRGLAPDGGLYVPSKQLPIFQLSQVPFHSYHQLAAFIFKPFLSDYTHQEIKVAIDKAYNVNFDHPSITPLHQLTSDLSILELWHGPTYAFKDIALQILPHLLSTAKEKYNESAEIVILTATSGDTGKSALEGFRDVPGIRIIVYYPENGVSEIQKLQMVTQEGSNVAVIAVKGNFDHTQNGVKQIFNDYPLAGRLAAHNFKLSSANSINWGRLLPQIVYYFKAYGELVATQSLIPGEAVNFVVPTGNFGNILAGYYAHLLGLPVNRFICAANRNNVLADFINSGTYNRNRELFLSLSPSMDILISSNLERLLFELTDHDPEQIGSWMKQLKEAGSYRIDPQTHSKIENLFWAEYADDQETLATINATFNRFQYLIDTHTAVGCAVYDKYRLRTNDQTKTVILSTASPFKFTRSVFKALSDSNVEAFESELTLLKTLAQKTGSQVPANLASLEALEIKHKQVISPEQMPAHLLTMLNID